MPYIPFTFHANPGFFLNSSINSVHICIHLVTFSTNIHTALKAYYVGELIANRICD